MIRIWRVLVLFGLVITTNENGYAQQYLNLNLDTVSNALTIKQQFTFKNTSTKSIDKIFLHAWANAYKTKTTALAKRFEEDYKRSFHLARTRNRGYIKIDKLTANLKPVKYQFLKDSIDILEIALDKPLQAGAKLNFESSYILKLPNAKFTKYGFNKVGNYYLKYFYLSPAVWHNGTFQLANNKGLNDLWQEKQDYTIVFKKPPNYQLITDLIQKNDSTYIGKSRNDFVFECLKKSNYKNFKFEDLLIKTDIYNSDKSHALQAVQLTRIKDYLESKLGKYPFKKLVLSSNEYSLNPVYGVNQLPSFVNPYPADFELDLKLLKIYLNNYFDKVLQLNKRSDYQFVKGIESYLMMDFIKQYYSDTKMLGKLSKIWGIRWFEVSKLDYNDKYWLYYQYIARKALDQPLDTPIDSLSNYNRNVANPFKAALGLRYIAAYTSDAVVWNAIKTFYTQNQKAKTSSKAFIEALKKESPKNLDWFFDTYTTSNKEIDYTIKKVYAANDSLAVIIKNKRKNAVPNVLYGIKDKKIVFKKWVAPIIDSDTIKVANGDYNRLVLNYENLYPEINQRDNWKHVNSHPLFNKPLKLGVIEDVENPFYNQLFIIPLSDFNYYDGIMLGAKFNNKTFLRKNFYFDVKPFLGLKSGSVTGSGNIFYKKRFQNRKLKSYRIGTGFSYYHFDNTLTYRKITPYLQFTFRDKNYRLSKRRILTLTQIRLQKDDDGTNPFGQEAVDYNVFNGSYVYKQPGEIKQFTTITALQFANNFGKATFDIRYKKLTLKNRQWDLRAYVGAFLYNTSTSGYYDFSLDRPTDYLFQYGYYGRSETTGILSQQYFIAEGGFKSRLVGGTANQWLVAGNAATSIWRWFEVYSDIGVVKNRNLKPKFFYDSGLRINLVPGQFEAFFPVYSSNGFEPSNNNYLSKIRLVYTTDLGSLFRFYKRSWH